LEQDVVVRNRIAGIIRRISNSGRLADHDELIKEMTVNDSSSPGLKEGIADYNAILKTILSENDDIREIDGADGKHWYYSATHVNEQYARMLARRGEYGLLAEIIREQSQIYPRPVPLDMFMEAPFDLTWRQIMDCLEEMNKDKNYEDILQTTTSMGTVFLYSTRGLDPVYASVLAEWFDVGEASNP
jgi:hypothetical protein